MVREKKFGGCRNVSIYGKDDVNLEFDFRKEIKLLTTNFLYVNLKPHPKALRKLGFLGRVLVTKNIDFHFLSNAEK